MSFSQGNPAVSHVISTANCLVFGNTSSGNALSVQQLGAGNVASFSNASGRVGLFVSATSNVGVGITNPSAPLHVNGQDAILAGTSTVSYSSNVLQLYTGATGTGYYQYSANLQGFNDGIGSVLWRFNTVNNGTSYPNNLVMKNGYVGIGTASPGTILDVYTADGAYGMRHTTGTVSMASFISSGSTAAPAQFGTTTNHKLGFYTNNGTPNVVIDTSGRVGIGTVSPAAPFSPGTLLHVYDAAGSPTILVDSSDGAGQARFFFKAGNGSTFRASRTDYFSNTVQIWTQIVDYNQTGNNDMSFSSAGKAYTSGSVLTLTQAGKVGIGTANPTASLHVTGPASSAVSNIVIETGTDAIGQRSEVRFGIPGFAGTAYRAGITSNTYSTNGNDIQLWTNASSGSGSVPRMTILPSGNVGIGTASPGELLTVSGNISMPTYSRLGINGGNSAGYLWTNFAKYGDAITLSYNFYNDGTNRFGSASLATSRVTLLYNEVDIAVSSSNGTEATVGVKLTGGSTSWAALSDSRLKDIIEPISNAIDKVDQLNPVFYTLKADESQIRRVGLIAQDVQAVLPEAVSTDNDGFLTLRYSELIPLAIGAIKELSAENTTLKTQMSALEARLAALESKLAA